MGVQFKQRRRILLRRLLQVDPPVPERSEEELRVEMEANYRWNFAVNFGDGAMFWFGLSFISAATILPLFVSKLSTDPFWFALLAVLGQASWYLPQLFAAGVTEKLARKKPIVINLGFFTERLPIWLLPIAALLAVQQPLLALLLFFLAYAWHGLGAGIIAPAWSDMLARCFPIDRRGWFFGLTAFIGTGIGTAGAVLSAWLLEAFPFPLNFSYTFLIAAVAITVSWGFLALTREPVQGVPESVRQQADQSWGKLGTIIGKDINFRTFLIARLLANLGRMGTGFITVAAIEQWNVSNSMVALFTASMLIGQTAGNLLAGLVADRRGHKVTLELGQWAMAIAFALAWLAPAPEWYYPVFFFMGAGTGIGIVSGVLIVLEFSRPEHRPSYIGLGNTTSGIGSAIAPIIGGFLAVISYRWLFLVSALVSLLALAVMWFNMREPRTHPQFVVGDDPTL